MSTAGLVLQTQLRVVRMLAGLDHARHHARFCLDRAGEAAEALAQLDADLQAATDILERARLVNERKHAAGTCGAAEQTAIRAVFSLRLAERSIENAHATVTRAQEHGAERDRLRLRHPP